MTAPLVDIGLNLTHDSFDHDRDAVIGRAADVGVRYMLLTGATLNGTRAAVELAIAHPATMRATAGIHPHHAAEFADERRAELEELLGLEQVIATGECGLDYFRNFSPHAAQERVFRLQLELAIGAQKPLFLHQRDAHDAFVAILREYLARTTGGVAHCFTGTLAEARDYLDMGLYVGITGWICDERRGEHLRDVVRYIPRDRLLIETDAPYLLPRDLQPKPQSRRNEPMHLPHVLATIARCRNEESDALGLATTQNAQRLFGWPSVA